jgi:hypothetical protein
LSKLNNLNQVQQNNLTKKTQHCGQAVSCTTEEIISDQPNYSSQCINCTIITKKVKRSPDILPVCNECIKLSTDYIHRIRLYEENHYLILYDVSKRDKYILTFSELIGISNCPGTTDILEIPIPLLKPFRLNKKRIVIRAIQFPRYWREIWH